MDQSIMGSYFDQEVRRRDDKIRLLGTEITSLGAEVEKKKSELQAIESSIEKSNAQLKGIDDKIAQENAIFEASKNSSIKALQSQEEALNRQKEAQDAKEKEIQNGWITLSSKISELELHKKEWIESLSEMSSGLNEFFSEKIESLKDL